VTTARNPMWEFFTYPPFLELPKGKRLKGPHDKTVPNPFGSLGSAMRHGTRRVKVNGANGACLGTAEHRNTFAIRT